VRGNTAEEQTDQFITE